MSKKISLLVHFFPLKKIPPFVGSSKILERVFSPPNPLESLSVSPFYMWEGKPRSNER